MTLPFSHFDAITRLIFSYLLYGFKIVTFYNNSTYNAIKKQTLAKGALRPSNSSPTRNTFSYEIHASMRINRSG
jgi:hypothetical protein